MKCLQVTKIVKEIKSGGVWDKLEAKECFRRQSFTKYLTWEIGHYGKSLTFVFEVLFASSKKILILVGRLVTRLSLYEV